uniref:NTR domain-containing protein n=1 Tax=Salvator merianae TaxID=96440 RepID=A0A8D0BJ17_SALMN
MDANQHYIINGDWVIDWPGVFEVAGAKVRYSRTADTHESLEADGPTQEDLWVMVLFREPSPGIEYQYWLPRERFYPVQSDASPLHQPQPREAGDGAMGEPPTTAAPRIPNPRGADKRECGKCETPKGKSQRIQHYCNSDFVFRARILSRRYLGLETRYDVQVKHTYRNRFPLVHREYVWVSNTCDCPLLTERREYVLMARRHVNYEHTLNRILLQRSSYARPWSPREDLQLRDAATLCPQRGAG